MVVPQNGWFIMVPNPIKMDDFGGLKTPIFGSTPILISLTCQSSTAGYPQPFDRRVRNASGKEANSGRQKKRETTRANREKCQEFYDVPPPPEN